MVYGVYTPPGFDPQSTIFTGGLNGRKITQFSHEVFVKPRSVCFLVLVFVRAFFLNAYVRITYIVFKWKLILHKP